MAKKLTEQERAARVAAKIEAARVKAEEKVIEDEIKAEEDTAKKETARIKTEEEARIEGVNKVLIDATIHPEVDDFSKMPEEWHERNKLTVEERKEADELIALRKADADALRKPASKVKRFSNNDIYELLAGLKADVDKETNIRRGEKPIEGVKPENAAQLVGLVQGLNVVIQRYKIYAKPSKAF